MGEEKFFQNSKRTDLLTGKKAEDFALSKTEFGNLKRNSLIGFNQSQYGLIKGNSGENEYFVVRLSDPESQEPITVEAIKQDAVKLVFDPEKEEQPEDAFNGKGDLFDIVIIDKKVGMPTQVYVNSDMLFFGSKGDRECYEQFAAEVWDSNASFATLKRIGRYFVNPDFMAAAKDRVRRELSSPERSSGKLERSRLMIRASKAIEKHGQTKVLGR